MPITKIEFFSARDVHLVRGQHTTEDLKGQITVTSVTGERVTLRPYLSQPANSGNVVVDFKPTFKIENTTAQAYSGFGITVDRKTGAVSVAGGTAPNPSPRNFLVEAIVTKNTGGVAPDTISPGFTRFHVHQRVDKVWLTPDPLTIRATPGSTVAEDFQEWTVRAQFDDGTVADISDSNQLKFTPESIMRDGENRIRIPETAAPGDFLDVTVKTSALWGNKSCTKKIHLLKDWSIESDVPRAEFIDGLVDVNDGTVRPEDAINVLIAACGWPAAAQDAFREIALAIVDRLSRNRLYQPFGYLSRSINFWRLPLVANEAGVNVRPEVRVYFQNDQLVAGPMFLPATPPASLAEWTVAHLLYAVGLPVPGDLSLIKDKQTQQVPVDLDSVKKRRPEEFEYGDLFTRWKKIARPRPGISFDQVPVDLAHRWIVLADRTFIDDVDAFPAVAVGEPPQLGIDPEQTRLGYDFRRNSSSELDRLLRRVTALPNPADGSVISLAGVPPDNALGNIWVVNPFDEATPRDWKFNNTRLVVGLCNSTIGRANNRILTRLALFMTKGPNTEVFEALPVTRVAGRSAVKLALDIPFRGALDDPTFNSFAHEVAHNFMLGDEYSEVEGTYTDDEKSLSHDANLTTEASVKDPSGIVAIDQIKWNWPRIQKSAAFTRPLVFRGNGLFHCTVRAAAGIRFAPGDKVLLRRRERDAAIGRAIVLIVSPIEFEVKEVQNPNVNAGLPVVDVTIVIQADDPFIDGPGIVTTFGMGVMYLPVAAPQTVVPARRYLTLIPPAAERILRSTTLTMTGNVCNLHADGNSVHVPVADPDGKLTPNVLPHVVGAYFGGARHACGVLRPTGMCMMRDHTLGPEQYKKDMKAPQGVSRFCVVCSYAMIEYADPDQHWLLDRDYATWYPF